MIHLDEDWVNDVLPGEIERSWDDADALYRVIETAIEGGLGEPIAPAAKRLVTIEGGSERSIVAWSVVLMRTKRLDDAEAQLTKFVAANGETGPVLTNLAKIQAERSDEALALRTLLRALQLDPNQENALGWYFSLTAKLRGEEEAEAALSRLSSEPKSWRPQLELGRLALERGDEERIEALYRDALLKSANGREAMERIAFELTGDSRPEQLIALIEPCYTVTKDDPRVGMLLSRALESVGRHAESFDLRNAVAYEHLDALCEASRVSADAEDDRFPTVRGVPWPAPLWAVPFSRPRWLLAKGSKGEVVAFYGLASLGGGEETFELSRTLPLYLAWKTRLSTDAEIATILPAVGGGRFFVPSERWDLPLCLDLLPRYLRPNAIVAGAITETGGLDIDIFDLLNEDVHELRIPKMASTTDLCDRAALEVSRALVATGRIKPAAAPAQLLPAPGQDLEPYLRALDRLAQAMMGDDTDLSFGPYTDLLALAPRAVLPKVIALAGLVSAAPRPKAKRPELAQYRAAIEKMAEDERKADPQGIMARLHALRR